VQEQSKVGQRFGIIASFRDSSVIGRARQQPNAARLH
jgi:hypothetical protein